MNTSSFKNFIAGLLSAQQAEEHSAYRDWRLVVAGSVLTLLTIIGLTLYVFMGAREVFVPQKEASVLNEEKLSAALNMIKQKDETFQGLKKDGFSAIDPSR